MRWCGGIGILLAVALTNWSALAQQGPRSDILQPLYMQADQLIYDTRGNRVIAQGDVEIYYNNYILTADQVTYDRSANTLVAEGNARLKEPDGTTRRSDRFEAQADWRDAFAQSLSVATQVNTRVSTAPR